MEIPENLQPLRTGDLLLITGEHSKALVTAQQVMVPSTESSHIALVHAETLCIDANPKLGVQNRFLTDVIQSRKTNWRAIRKRALTPEDQDRLLQAAPFFLLQSYLIHPSEKIGKSKSYCSELARKVFQRAQVPIAIPNSGLVIPGHFDLLRQQSEDWQDITDAARSWVAFVEQHEAPLRLGTKTMINGLKLNRKRFFEREEMRKLLLQKRTKGQISAEAYSEALEVLNRVDREVTYRFWDAPQLAKA